MAKKKKVIRKKSRSVTQSGKLITTKGQASPRITIPTLDREQIVPFLATMLLIVAGWLVFMVYRSYAWPVFLALLIYVGFDGINRQFIRIFKGSRNLAALVTVILVVLLILLPSIYLFAHLIEELIDLGLIISSALKSRRILYTLQSVPFLADFFTTEPFFWVELLQLLQSSSNEYMAMLDTTSLGNWVSNIFFVLKGSVALTLAFLLNMVMALIILFFLFRDGPSFYTFFRKVLPFPKVMIDKFTDRMQTLIKAVLWGNVFVSFMQGAMISIGLSICNIDNSIVYGVVAAIFSLIPIVGTAVVWAPTALYLFAKGDYGLALFITIYGIAMYLILENIFKPKLLDRKLGMHPLLLFLAILGGLTEFGISGVILGPLFVTLFMTMWSIYHVWGSDIDYRVPSK